MSIEHITHLIPIHGENVSGLVLEKGYKFRDQEYEFHFLKYCAKFLKIVFYFEKL